MLERNISLYQCPEQHVPVTKLDVQERRTINNVEHVYTAQARFKDKTYPVDEGILRLGAHENESLYNQIWTSDDRISRGNVGQQQRAKLLFLLGRKTLGFLEGKNFIDIGGGLGYRSQAAAQLGADVVVMDSSFSGLRLGMNRMAEQLSPEEFARVDFVQADIMTKVVCPEKFDVVFSSYALHHTFDTRKAIQVIADYTKHNGYLAVTVFVPEDYFPNTMWVCRQDVLSVPREIRQRALMKAGMLPQEGYTPIVNVPEIVKKIKSDPDLAAIAEAVGLDYLVHRENLDTEYIWIQSRRELAKWFEETGFSVEYQKGETTVGRRRKPNIVDKIKRII